MYIYISSKIALGPLPPSLCSAHFLQQGPPLGQKTIDIHSNGGARKSSESVRIVLNVYKHTHPSLQAPCFFVLHMDWSKFASDWAKDITPCYIAVDVNQLKVKYIEQQQCCISYNIQFMQRLAAKDVPSAFGRIVCSSAGDDHPKLSSALQSKFKFYCLSLG